MTIVTISKKEIKKIIGNVNDEKIDYDLNMFGLGVEKIDSDNIDVEVTPNRPDMLSQAGILRALESYFGKKPGLKQYKLHEPEKNYEVKIDKSVKDIRPYTACAIVRNLKFNDEKIKEIIDIQEKIHSSLGRNRKKIAIGIYPLEEITFPITFEARKPQEIKFIPLESNEPMNGLQILQRHPTGREYAHLLAGKTKFPIFIDSAGEILSMPPIINSNKTGKITEKTQNIFIECSGFDFNLLKKAINILITVLADLGGEVYKMKLDYNGKEEITPDLNPQKMKIEIENANKLIGLQLKEDEVKKLLEKMGYEYKNKEVLIPAWRTDVIHEVDIIEDIAIAYGYDKLNPEIPQIATMGGEDRKEIIKRKIAEILLGLNSIEISTLHLITKDDLKNLGLKQAIEVEQSKTDYTILRPNLLVSAIKILSENTDVEYPQKIFEIGKTFEIDRKEETEIKEKEKLLVAVTPGNFTEIKQILEYLGKVLEIKFKIEEASNSSFIKGRTGKVIFEEKEIGTIGEIHPSILKDWHLKAAVSALEIDLEEIFKRL